MSTPAASPYRHHWQLDAQLAFLNHGSFGACPRVVLEHQRNIVDEAERDPIYFFNRRRQQLLDESRGILAACVGADPSDLVFDTNATHALNAVLRWTDFREGDEILVTSHGYNAITNAARYVADQSGAEVVTVTFPLPVTSRQQLVDAVLGALTARTRMVILDHITSPTALVLPLEEILPVLRQRGILSLVDGAHGPGAIALNLRELAPDYYAANCHKWLCSPRGAAFLFAQPHCRVRELPPRELQPSSVSHGYNTQGPMQNRFHDAFDFPGTTDPSAWASVGFAIRFLDALRGTDLADHLRCNRQLAQEGARLLEQQCGLRRICPPQLNGPMVSLLLPDDPDPQDVDATTSPNATLMLHTRLWKQYAIEVPVFHFPKPPQRMLRISAQAYNSLDDYQRLADALNKLLAER
jgi:isopenicillin-N epimerase